MENVKKHDVDAEKGIKPEQILIESVGEMPVFQFLCASKKRSYNADCFT